MGFGRPTAPLVDIVENDTGEEVRRVFEVGSLDSQRSQLLGQPIPAIKRTIVYINDL